MSLGTLVLGFEDQIWFQTEPKTFFNKCNHKLPCFLSYVGFNIHFSFAIFARAPCSAFLNQNHERSMFHTIKLINHLLSMPNWFLNVSKS